MSQSELQKPTYDRMAKFYDAMFAASGRLEPWLNSDIPLYLSFAEPGPDPGRPINRYLDVGCGTGRVTQPFLNNGYMMTGIDISNAMLDVFRKKPKVKEYIRAGQLRLLPFDFSRGTINDQFHGAFVTGTTLSFVPEESQVQFLENVGQTLIAGSPILVDLFYPPSLIDPTIQNKELHASSFEVKGKRVDLYITRWIEKHNVERRIRKFKCDNEEVFDETERVYVPPVRGKELLEKAGFKNIQIIRRYDRSTLSQEFIENKQDYNFVLVGYK